MLRRSSTLEFEEGYLSVPQAIEFPTENGLTAHAFFYPPQNRDYAAPPGEQPPLLVMSHGGPTAATGGALRMGVQYWTSRGIAVLDVNYGGSTGYGQAYRQRLNGQWGVVDVDDCANGARYLAERGDVDGDRLIIRGGSAGGYTTLCALTFRDVFKAGASYYGIGDLEALAKELSQTTIVRPLNALELFMQIEQEFPGKSELIWTKAVAVNDAEEQATLLTALEYTIKMMRLAP